MEKVRRPWWLYLNLIGLDAPLIAVVWLFLFAKTWRVNYHPWEAYVALGLAVWAVRMTGKILDGAMNDDPERFAVRHGKVLRLAVIVSGISALVLTVLNFPRSVYAYLLVACILVLGYFALALFSSKGTHEISYAKHGIGGVAFAYGTALVAHVYLPNLGIQQMITSREFICFSMLCLLASSGTELWEHSMKFDDREIRATDELALSLPLTLLGAASLVFAVQNDSMLVRPFFYAILTGAALLQVLNRTHGKFRIGTVKVLASMCLLAPGMIFEAYAISR